MFTYAFPEPSTNAYIESYCDVNKNGDYVIYTLSKTTIIVPKAIMDTSKNTAEYRAAYISKIKNDTVVTTLNPYNKKMSLVEDNIFSNQLEFTKFILSTVIQNEMIKSSEKSETTNMV